MVVSMSIVVIGVIAVTMSWSCLSFANLVTVKVRVIRILLVDVMRKLKEVLGRAIPYVGVWTVEAKVICNTGFEVLARGAIVCNGVGSEVLEGVVIVCGGVRPGVTMLLCECFGMPGPS